MMTNFNRAVAQLEGLSVSDLEKLAEQAADMANAKRKPEHHHGNRKFTFVTTYADCAFPHPVFQQEKLPTNAEAREMGPDVAVLPPDGKGQAKVGKLVAIVHGAGGAPLGYIKWPDRTTRWEHSYDSTRHLWIAQAD